MAKFQIKYLYPLLLAAFPVLALFVNNYGEVGWGVVPRPLLISVGMAGLVLLFFRALLKNWAKATLMAAWFLLTFYLYGHVRNWLLESLPELGRQRNMIPIWIIVTFSGVWFLWRAKYIRVIVQLLTNISVMGIVILILQIIWFQFSIWRFQDGLNPQKELAELTINSESPDIYYIILDSYTRSDVLLKQFSYDNSKFIQALESRGFFIAECSQSNYPTTYSSLSSSMSSSYLTDVYAKYQNSNLPSSAFGVLITDSWVENSLSNAGYLTVGYETEWDWLNNSDADVYYRKSVNTVNSFEFMLINTSSAVIVWDILAKLIPSIDGFDLRAWSENQLTIIEQAQVSVRVDSPKFEFVHIAIPHQPYVFQVDGPLPNLDSAFSREPYIKKYEGYRRQVEFINTRIVSLIDTINNSGEPVVIILQGDHGSRIDNDKYPILNAFYFSNDDGSYPDLYHSISPVNTFRVVFNRYFGTKYQILPDSMYDYINSVYFVVDDLALCEQVSH